MDGIFFAIFMAPQIAFWAFLAWQTLRHNLYWSRLHREWRQAPRFSFEWWFNAAFPLVYLGCLVTALFVVVGRTILGT